MDELKPRKTLPDDADRRVSSAHPAVSRGAAFGTLKGERKPERMDRSGRVKPSVAEARKQAADAEREPGRTGLPLPPPANSRREPEGHSLGLRLQVSGDRITVLDSIAVDTATAAPEPVRGTDFLAVHAGPKVIAVKRLIDPGLAFGIPDADDPERRGHREVVLDTYELTILVPLEPIDRMNERDDPDHPDQRPAAIEIVMYRANETTTLEPRELKALRDREDVRAVAWSGELTTADLRETLWTSGRGRPVKPPQEEESAD